MLFDEMHSNYWQLGEKFIEEKKPTKPTFCLKQIESLKVQSSIFTIFFTTLASTF